MIQDTLNALQAAIAFSKKPGNEGQCLHNGKAYRPVAEVLTPVQDILNQVDILAQRIVEINLDVGHTTSARLISNATLSALEDFKANLTPNLNAANNAKRNMIG